MEIGSAFDWLEKNWAQSYMYIVFCKLALVFFVLGTVAVEADLWGLLSPGMFVMTIGLTALHRKWLEKNLDGTFLKANVMSWSFVVGGIFVMPMALWFAGRSRSSVVMKTDERWLTLLVSVIVGLAVMVMFRKFDGDRYRSADWGSALFSPSKVWIDFVVVPVSSAMVMWLMLPQIMLRVLGEPERAGMGGDTFIAVGFLLGFLSLVIADAINPPDPRRQHCRWNRRAYARDHYEPAA